MLVVEKASTPPAAAAPSTPRSCCWTPTPPPFRTSPPPLHLSCSSPSNPSSLHCPLSGTSLALYRSRRRCSGLAASLNSLCRRSAAAEAGSCQSDPAESRGVELRPSAGILLSLSLSRTQAAVAVAPRMSGKRKAVRAPRPDSGCYCPSRLIPPQPLSQLMHLHLIQLPGLEIAKLPFTHIQFVLQQLIFIAILKRLCP